MKTVNRNVAIGAIGLGVLITIITILFVAGTRITTKTLPEGNITVTTPYQTYLLGEEITFTVHNNFNSSIVLKNNCPTEPLDVYRYENDKWVRIHDTADSKACMSNQRMVTIPANGQRDASFASWPRLFDKPGKYRIVAYVDYYEQLPFADFEIIEKPSSSNPQAAISSTISKNVTPTVTTPSTSTSNASSSQNNTSTPSRSLRTISLEQGVIVAESDTKNIYIKSITPNSGWRYEGGNNGPQVEVTFKRSEQEVKVTLQLKNGSIVYFTEQDDD